MLITKEYLLNVAERTLRIEEETLKEVRLSLNDDFADAVMHLYDSDGRLVVTGIGKSAIIGQKIVATLNSTGTPSLFMHAADAIHGDLGMVQASDTVLCLSKSGETPEVKALVRLLLYRGILLIGMSAVMESYLMRHAQYRLYTPVSQEADPNNLAPTASTTAQAAMGDALATALLAMRGFTARDFAHFHPGGTLGKQLYLQVKHLLELHEKPAVRLRDPLRQVIMEITEKRLGATAVLDDEGGIQGIITDGDLRRMLERQIPTDLLTAKDVMCPTPKTIAKDAMAVEALTQLRSFSISQLLVTDADGTYIGMIHLHDLLREGLA